MRNALITLAVLSLIGAPAARSADEPAKPTPELRVLEDLVGSWDEVVTNKPTDWMPKAERSTTLTKKTWSLGAKFIRMEGTFEPAKNDFLALVSYDAAAKVYRMWYFDAAGAMPRGLTRGTWDEKTRTMTWNDTDEDGNKAVSKHKIVDKDNNEWTLVVKNPDGKVVLDMAGKCTRHKP